MAVNHLVYIAMKWSWIVQCIQLWHDWEPYSVYRCDLVENHTVYTAMTWLRTIQCIQLWHGWEPYSLYSYDMIENHTVYTGVTWLCIVHYIQVWHGWEPTNVLSYLYRCCRCLNTIVIQVCWTIPHTGMQWSDRDIYLPCTSHICWYTFIENPSTRYNAFCFMPPLYRLPSVVYYDLSLS